MFKRNFLSFVLFVLLCCLLIPTASSLANARNQPPPLPGWIHAPPFSDDTPEAHGVIVAGNEFVRGSPTIADIDGNTTNGQEVIIGGIDGQLYAFRANGSLLWGPVQVPATTCTSADGLIQTAPAVGRIFGSGDVPYVVVGYGTIIVDGCDGGVAVFNGVTGALAWRFSTVEWERQRGDPVESNHGVVSSPGLADTDGDGRMEIGFAGINRYIYLLNADGSVRWYYDSADSVRASPSFVNIDNDTALEMIVGADISGNDALQTPNGGFVYAFDTQTRPEVRIPFYAPISGIPTDGIVVWRTQFNDQAIYSSPAIADVLSTNPGNEIIVGSSCFFPVGSNEKLGKWVKILDARTGAELQTLNADDCVQSSPALGDLDDDGQLEIVAVTRGQPGTSGTDFSRVQAWDPTNPTPIWTATPLDANSGVNDPSGGDLQSPVIADLDGNGSLEVAVTNFWSVHVLNGRTGEPLTCQGAGCTQPALFAWKTLKATPAIGDIDADGDLDLVTAGGNIFTADRFGANRGVVYAWTDFAGRLNSPTGTQPAYSAPWPQFQKNPENNGVFATLTASVSEVTTLVANTGRIGRTASAQIILSTNWQAQVITNPDNLVTLTRTQGTASDPLVLTVATDEGASTGTNSVTIRVTDPTGASTSVVDVTVNIVVANQVFINSLPNVTTR